MGLVTGLSLSLIYLGIILIIAFTLRHFKHNLSRTFIHIMAAHWWMIVMVYVDSYWFVLGASLLFLIFNSLNVIFKWIPFLIAKGKFEKWGAVYYSFSIVCLVATTYFTPELKMVGGVGILALGYGDGFASLIGQYFGKHPYTIFKGHKSLEGSLAMGLATLVSIAIFFYAFHVSIPIMTLFSIAALAMVVEALSPYGLDNVFVPLITALFYFICIF